MFEFMYCDFIKTKRSSYSSLSNNYIQGRQVLCNHATVFRVLIAYRLWYIYIIYFFEKMS